MISETDNGTMVELKLNNGLDFHRQRGTILTWKRNNLEEDDDTAISFQEKEGIKEVWYISKIIQAVYLYFERLRST
jgi:hypothetical protein